MMILPVPVSSEEFSDVIDAATSGSFIEGPWNDSLRDALEALASTPSDTNLETANAALVGWVAEWNAALTD